MIRAEVCTVDGDLYIYTIVDILACMWPRLDWAPTPVNSRSIACVQLLSLHDSGTQDPDYVLGILNVPRPCRRPMWMVSRP